MGLKVDVLFPNPDIPIGKWSLKNTDFYQSLIPKIARPIVQTFCRDYSPKQSKH